MSRIQSTQTLPKMRFNLTTPNFLTVLEEQDDSGVGQCTEGRVGCRNESNGEDESNDTQLFHTICVAGNVFAFPDPRHNVSWFVLEESIMELCENHNTRKTAKRSDSFLSTSRTKSRVEEAHDIVDSLIRSQDNHRLLFGRFKTNLLPKIMSKLRASYFDEERFFETLTTVWNRFWLEILSTIECMFYRIEMFSNDSIRNASIAAFRDHFILNSNFEEFLKNAPEVRQDATLRQMMLIIQSLRDSSNKTTRIEKITAQFCEEYLGSSGYYSRGELVTKARQIPVQVRAQPFNPSTLTFQEFTANNKHLCRNPPKRKLTKKISIELSPEQSWQYNNVKYLKFLSKLYK